LWIYAQFKKKQQFISITIESFGAIADGTTDCYYPFKLASLYAASHANTTITFGSGTYYIAKYRSVDNDTTDHIHWNNCSGLKLIGVTGTKISLNGTFFRNWDYSTSDCSKKSFTSGLSPFWFDNCSDLEIRNMEITGNCQNTTRAPGSDENNPSVTESSNILLRLTKCTDVLVDSMYLHHAEVDGLWIGGDRIGGVWINTTNITVTNTRCLNNCRQGLSAGGISNGYFKNCEFSFSGFVGGTYGHNDPAAGVDLEPGLLHFDDGIFFEDCKFENNYGGQFLCAGPLYTSNLTLLKCTVTAVGSQKNQGITILTNGALIDSCIISMGTRDLKITNVAKPGSKITIRNSTIDATRNFLLTESSNPLDSVVIENNDISYIGSTMTTNLFTLRTTKLKFLNNTIYISPAAIASRPTGFHAVVANAIISSGNVFSSGMRVDYSGTTTVSDP